MQVDALLAGELTAAAATAASEPMDTSEERLIAAASQPTDTMEVSGTERAQSEVQNFALPAPVIPRAKSAEAGTVATRELAALARESLLEAERRLAEAFAAALNDPESASSQHALCKLADHSRRLQPARQQREAEETARLQSGLAAAVQQEQERPASEMEVERGLHPKPRGYAHRDPSSAAADAKCSWDATVGCWMQGDGSALLNRRQHEQADEQAARTTCTAELEETRERQLPPGGTAVLCLEASKPDGKRQDENGCFCWQQSDGRCTCECTAGTRTHASCHHRYGLRTPRLSPALR